ncbi:hypothetical protein K488DRAFT_86142 [Vararia minispora EC-137]|uniref:Uncharacterized protein n=1 Tax=Vararia minispora EC-137 TaxID=1314806 RepID=A0ACB8QJY1_9AGAM|nr:hypothetical protein K488DRAFT_86142 [Vararia minispora EC-137]
MWRQRLQRVDGEIKGGWRGPGLQAKIDSDILLLKDEMQLHTSSGPSLGSLIPEFKKRRNACVPFFSLPLEITQQIVVTLIQSDWGPKIACGYCRFFRTRSSLGWIVLGHVCHALLEILLHESTAWARIVCVFPKATSETLRRAGQAPLALDVDGIQCRHAMHIIPFALSNLHRARTIAFSNLHLYCVQERKLGPWPFDPYVLSGDELPMLEEVKLELQGFSQQPRLGQDVFSLTPIRAPRLRSVSLINVYIPFDPSTLTSLQLHNYRSLVHETGPLLSPTPNQFLRILSSCTNLHTLDLYDYIPPDLLPADKPTINLRRLQKLFVSDSSFGRCRALWSHLDLHPTTRIALTLTCVPEATIRSNDYLGALAPFASRSHSIQGLGVYLTSDERSIAFVLAASSPGSSPAFPLRPRTLGTPLFEDDFDAPLIFIFRRENIRSEIPLPPAFDRLVTTMALSNIEYLEFEPPSSTTLEPRSREILPSIEEWHSILAPLSRVHTLSLINKNSSEFPLPTCLLIPALSRPSQLSGTLPLPSLRSLRLAHLSLLEPQPRWWSYPEPDGLLACLRVRKDEGMPLESLRIDRLLCMVQGRHESALETSEHFILRVQAVVRQVDCKLEDGDPPQSDEERPSHFTRYDGIGHVRELIWSDWDLVPGAILIM